jgi:rhodanese-related sulfurtransferase
VSIQELSIRRRGPESAITPEYPPESIERATGGVAVTAILIGTDGRVESCELLQAPDSAIGRASVRAAGSWVFPPVAVEKEGRRVPAKVMTKLTFYFVPERGAVLSPAPTGPDTLDAIASLLDGLEDVTIPDITEGDLARLLAGQEGVVVMDIRPRELFARGHRNAAVNIPADELVLRLRELSSTRSVAVDCFPGTREVCRRCAHLVRARTGSEVYVVNRE